MSGTQGTFIFTVGDYVTSCNYCSSSLGVTHPIAH